MREEIGCDDGFQCGVGLGFGISIWGFKIQLGLTRSEGVDKCQTNSGRSLCGWANLKGLLKTHKITIYILIKFMPHLYSVCHVNRFR